MASRQLPNIDKLLDNYTSWLRSQYRVKSLTRADEVTTPFVNMIGDHLIIYIRPIGNGQVEISDDGATLSDLELLGIDMSASLRQKIIKPIKSAFGIQQKDDVFFARGSVKNFPVLQQNFISDILQINGMASTRKYGDK